MERRQYDNRALLPKPPKFNSKKKNSRVLEKEVALKRARELAKKKNYWLNNSYTPPKANQKINKMSAKEISLAKGLWNRYCAKKNSLPKVLEELRRNQGVSYRSVEFFCHILGFNNNTPLEEFKANDKKRVNKFKVTLNLPLVIRKMHDKINVKKKMRSYKGTRHLEGLPVRNQRTKTNAQTSKKKHFKRRFHR